MNKAAAFEKKMLVIDGMAVWEAKEQTQSRYLQGTALFPVLSWLTTSWTGGCYYNATWANDNHFLHISHIVHFKGAAETVLWPYNSKENSTTTLENTWNSTSKESGLLRRTNLRILGKLVPLHCFSGRLDLELWLSLFIRQLLGNRSRVETWICVFWFVLSSYLGFFCVYSIWTCVCMYKPT